MAQTPEIEGPDGEKWHSWLVSDKDEVAGIKSDKLRTHIRILARRPDLMNTAGHLQEVHGDIESMLLSGEITDEDTAPWLSRIAMRHEQLVGEERNNQPPIIIQPPQERAPARDQALYIGAVFHRGHLEPLLVAPEMVEMLDATKPADRRKFVLRNIYAFDNLYLKSTRMSAGWLSAAQMYETDLRVAMEKGVRVPLAEVEKTYKFIQATMGVTASARSMEISGGSFDEYGRVLTGGDKGPNSSWQDENIKYLLHADTEKIALLLNDPTIAEYYKKLMSDAGLSQNVNSEWHGDNLQTPSELTFSKSKQSIAQHSQLVGYLKDMSSLGGFEGYINEILLREVNVSDSDMRIKKAAARIACDIFLVDKYTRWSSEVSDASVVNLKLQPCVEWGGDPLDAVIHPTGLQRIKGVYSGSDSKVLDLIDEAFRPTQIYESLQKKHLRITGKSLSPSIRPPFPSMVTNIKTLARYTQALGKITGGPMAPNLSVWGGPAMNDLAEAERLIAQVYGGQKIDDIPDGASPTGTRKYEVGKEIAGASIITIFEAKALATSLESSAPGSADVAQMVFDPDSKTRPFFEARTFLLGQNLNYKGGHLEALQGGDFNFVIAGNYYAQKHFDELMRLIQTNDQTGKVDIKKLNAISGALKIGQAIARAAGLVR